MILIKYWTASYCGGCADAVSAEIALGQIYAVSKKDESCIKVLQKAVKRAESVDPLPDRLKVTLPIAIEILADALLRTGQKQEALEAYHKSLTTQPVSLPWHYTLPETSLPWHRKIISTELDKFKARYTCTVGLTNMSIPFEISSWFPVVRSALCLSLQNVRLKRSMLMTVKWACRPAKKLFSILSARQNTSQIYRLRQVQDSTAIRRMSDTRSAQISCPTYLGTS